VLRIVVLRIVVRLFLMLLLNLLLLLPFPRLPVVPLVMGAHVGGPVQLLLMVWVKMLPASW
jgi:hypothetical protein